MDFVTRVYQSTLSWAKSPSLPTPPQSAKSVALFAVGFFAGLAVYHFFSRSRSTLNAAPIAPSNTPYVAPVPSKIESDEQFIERHIVRDIIPHNPWKFDDPYIRELAALIRDYPNLKFCFFPATSMRFEIPSAIVETIRKTTDNTIWCVLVTNSQLLGEPAFSCYDSNIPCYSLMCKYDKSAGKDLLKFSVPIVDEKKSTNNRQYLANLRTALARHKPLKTL